MPFFEIQNVHEYTRNGLILRIDSSWDLFLWSEIFSILIYSKSKSIKKLQNVSKSACNSCIVFIYLSVYLSMDLKIFCTFPPTRLKSSASTFGPTALEKNLRKILFAISTNFWCIHGHYVSQRRAIRYLQYFMIIWNVIETF